MVSNNADQQTKEQTMTKITKKYANQNNGGQERITRDGDKFYVSSDWGNGFSRSQQVSRSQAETCLSYTNAPADVVAAILG